MGKLLFIPMQTENQFKMIASITNRIFKMYGDLHEVYAMVASDWEERMAILCPRIKLATFSHPNEQLQKEWIARTGKNKNEILAKLCEEYVHIWNHGKKTDMVIIVNNNNNLLFD